MREAPPANGKRALPSRELQELWFATRRRDWKSLVVVPAGQGLSALPIAQALGEVGGAIRLSPVQVVNAEGLDLDRIAQLVMDMSPEFRQPDSVWTSGSVAGGRVSVEPRISAHRVTIIAIDAVAENPLVLPVALAADAVLLCVVRGQTNLREARHTVELIGRDRMIGAVLLNSG